MLERFRQDAARWIVPQKIADPREVTLGVAIKLLWRHVPLRAMLRFRMGQWCHEHGIPGLPSWFQRRLLLRFGLEITVGADIGGGLYIAHPSAVVLAPSSMGENCTVISAVTVGMRNTHAFPRIGDRVFFGAGARVLGDIAIGNDATIGANAVVIKDVPEGTTVVGVPARAVTRPIEVSSTESHHSS
jgi:serine O-acetyltransferase